LAKPRERKALSIKQNERERERERMLEEFPSCELGVYRMVAAVVCLFSPLPSLPDNPALHCFQAALVPIPFQIVYQPQLP
jgi:hypothetical protein